VPNQIGVHKYKGLIRIPVFCTKSVFCAQYGQINQFSGEHGYEYARNKLNMRNKHKPD